MKYFLYFAQGHGDTHLCGMLEFPTLEAAQARAAEMRAVDPNRFIRIRIIEGKEM